METTETKKNNSVELWKIAALLSIGILIGIFASDRVLAFDSLKWQICGGLNISGGDCDDFWVQLKGEVQSNSTMNLDGYYNKSELDLKIQLVYNNFTDYYKKQDLYNRTEIQSNSSLNSSVELSDIRNNLTQFVTIKDFTDFKNNFSDKFLLRSEYFPDSNNNNSNNDFDPMWVIVIILGAAALLFLFKDKMGNTKSERPSAVTKEQIKKEALMELMKEQNKSSNKSEE